MRGWWLGLLATACMGPNEETLIAELRLVAMAADPPAVEPGEAYDLTLTVADPLGEGGDLLVWSCVPTNLGAEGPTATPSSSGSDAVCARERRALDAEQITVPAVGAGPVPIWALACAPGRCGDLDEATDDELTDPVTWLQGLPITGVSAGFRTVGPVPEGEDPPVNPPIDLAPEAPIVADTEVGAELSFVVPGAETAYGFATAGGFSTTSYDVSMTGKVDLTWFGPAEEADDAALPARLYVVFEDGRGGVSVWIGNGG